MAAWRTGLVVPLYLAASITFTWPLAARFTRSIPSTGTLDPPLQAFLIGWDIQALGRADVLSPPIFHPEPRALTYMDSMSGEALVARPAVALASSVAAGYNLLVLLSFTTSGWFTYRLVRLFRVPRAGAFLCGFLYAFSAYRYANLDLLNQLQTQFLPLGLFFGLRYLQRWKLRDAFVTLLVLPVQILFGWYYAFALAVALGLMLLWALVIGSWVPPRGHAPRLLGVAALGMIAVAFLAWPYLERRVAMPEFRRTLGESALYSADVLDYVRFHRYSALARSACLPTGDQSYWPGTATLLLGVVGIAYVWARSRQGAGASGVKRATFPLAGAWLRSARERIQGMGSGGYVIVLALGGFVLSLGPILHVPGQRLWIPLPYAALYYLIPGFSGIRAPARFAALVLLAAVLAAGLGFERLSSWMRRSGAAWGRCIPAALFALAAVEAWISPLSLLELPTDRTTPAAYRWLAGQPAGPLLELPVPERDEDENEAHALRQYALLFHGKPRLDGVSGFVSRRYREFRRAVQSFPGEPGFSAAGRFGARWILVHYGDYAAARRRWLEDRIADEPRLIPRARFGGDVVYELTRSAP